MKIRSKEYQLFANFYILIFFLNSHLLADDRSTISISIKQ